MSTLAISTITTAPRHAAQLPTLRQPARPVGHARPGSVRLTRRGRVVVFLLAFAVVAAVAVFLAAGSAATREAGETGAITVVTVAPGESLWAIASEAAAGVDVDVRDVMEQIRRLNTLDSSMVYAGQELRVPAL